MKQVPALAVLHMYGIMKGNAFLFVIGKGRMRDIEFNYHDAQW